MPLVSQQILRDRYQLQEPLGRNFVCQTWTATDLADQTVDFGAVQDKTAATGRRMTVAGTYGYAPLEQFSGQAIATSDLYGLGATLIHILRIRDSPYPLQGSHTIKTSEIRRVYTIGNNPKKMAVALETPHGVISIGLTALTGEGNNQAPRISQILSSAEATWLADAIRTWIAETPAP